MKNPFVKEDSGNAIVIAAFVAGAAIAGAITYYFVQKRKANAAAAEAKEHAQDYLKAKPFKQKKHKTDIDDLTHIIQPLS